jgi:hypothetical protein
MNLKQLNEIIKKYLDAVHPVNVVLFIVVILLNLLQDYFSTGNLIGVNGFLISINMILYFILLHSVFVFSVREKPTNLVKQYAEVKIDQFEVNVKPPSNTKEGFLSNKEITKRYFIYLSILVILSAIWGLLLKTGGYEINKTERLQMYGTFILICLTVTSEFMLVSGVFNNQMITPVKLIKKIIL